MISPDRLEKGFALTGVETFVSDLGTRTQEILSELITRKDIGIVIIPEEHLADFDPRTRKKLDELQMPLIVPIPMERRETASPEKYVSQLVRRAIGYEIKI